MQPLTCPIPSNINPLQTNGFMFAINKLPSVSYFCQEVSLPELTLGGAPVATPLVDYPIPGEKLEFGQLSITFLIDETMANYVAIHQWLVGLGFPKTHEQYRAFLNQSVVANEVAELYRGYSDGTLAILNNTNTPTRTITFRDMFPINLGALQLQSTTDSTTYLAGNATFMYTMYEFT